MIEIIISNFVLAMSVFIAGSIVYSSLKNGITPMPTSNKVKRHLMTLLDQEIIHSRIYDLGSGWGTLAVALADKYGDCCVTGFENSMVPYLVSLLRSRRAHHRNLTIARENFFNQPLNDADLVVCYLYPGAMEKLKIKFENELKVNTVVVSNTFAIPSWLPVKKIVVDDLYRTHLYLYIVGRH